MNNKGVYKNGIRPRIIPSLQLHNNGLVKTRIFKNPVYVGDPINAIRIFNEKGVDELVIVDIHASKENKEPNYSLIEQFASECFMPLGYGGGITKVDQVRRILSLGVEKVILQSAFFENETIVRELSGLFGSQSIIVSVDIKKNIFGKHRLFHSRWCKTSHINWQDFVLKAVESGAGEILIKSVDQDGTMKGPDLNLIQQCTRMVDIPVVAQGGIGNLHDIQACLNAGASAIAAGAFFVFKGPYRTVLINYPSQKELELLKVLDDA